MQLVRVKPAHKDRRGVIVDIIDNALVDAVTFITSKKGSVRGNHYHKKTTQYTYILSGRMRLFEQPPRGRLTERVLKSGDLVITPPNVRHAFVALADSTIIACSRGPRRGKQYENDTYRLDAPLNKRK